MAVGQAVHIVRLVALEHVRLQQRVVRDAAEPDAVIGEHVLVVLEVLPELRGMPVLEPWPEPRQDFVEVELLRRASVAMRERQIGGVPGLDRERDADQPRLQRVETGRFGVDRYQRGGGELLQPLVELVDAQDRFVVPPR